MLQQRFLYSNANHYVIFGADSYDDVLVVLKCPRSLRGAPPRFLWLPRDGKLKTCRGYLPPLLSILRCAIRPIA